MKSLTILVFFLLLINTIASQSSIIPKEPLNVNVSLLLLNIENFDISEGSYIIDFYLTLSCEYNCSVDNFEFMNGRAITNKKIFDDGKEKVYRISAQLVENINLRDFPFDKHTLTVEIEDEIKTTKELIYQPDLNRTAIDNRLAFVGWQFLGWQTNVTEHYYPTFDETYSNYLFQINIKRITIASIIKIFVPATLLLLIAILALFIRPDDSNEIVGRIAIATSALVAEVIFHLSVTSTLPQIGYATFLDKFMFASYFSILFNLASTVLIMEYDKLKYKIHELSLVVVPILTLLGYLIVFLID